MTCKADIVCVQETRPTAAGQRAMTMLAQKMGWRALWGAPLPPSGAGMRDIGPGGVGILYQPSMVMQLVAPPMSDEATQALWECGTWPMRKDTSSSTCWWRFVPPAARRRGFSFQSPVLPWIFPETVGDPSPPPPPGISPRQTRSQVQTQCRLPHSLHFSCGSFSTLYASPSFVM